MSKFEDFYIFLKTLKDRQIASLQKLERDTIDNHATLIENYGFLRKVHWFTFVVGSLKNVAIPARTLFLTPRTVPEIKRSQIGHLAFLELVEKEVNTVSRFLIYWVFENRLENSTMKHEEQTVFEMRQPTPTNALPCALKLQGITIQSDF